MKKDKLITIRVTEETRDKFNDWCKANKLKGSIFLYEIISGCINGHITPSLTSQKIDNSIDSKASQKIVELENQVKNLSSQLDHLEQDLGEKLYNKLYNSISNKLINKSIDKDIDESLDLDISIDKSIDSDLVENPTIVETEMTELEEVEDQDTITITPECHREAVKRDSTRVRRQDKWKDISEGVENIESGRRFTIGSFSREILGIKSKSTVSGWIQKIKKGNLEKLPSWFVEQFEYQVDHQDYDKIVKK